MSSDNIAPTSIANKRIDEFQLKRIIEQMRIQKERDEVMHRQAIDRKERELEYQLK
jgi:hypothetical protein